MFSRAYLTDIRGSTLTQFAAVGERFAALLTLVRLVASMTALVTSKSRLSGKLLAANRAFEILVLG